MGHVYAIKEFYRGTAEVAIGKTGPNIMTAKRRVLVRKVQRAGKAYGKMTVLPPRRRIGKIVSKKVLLFPAERRRMLVLGDALRAQA